ncbi:MAG: hypothetical protein AB1505_05385 [Candidatus Latescibacterota bacterium]
MAITSRVAVVVAGLAASALAQEERIVDNFAGVGARAMGMGGAFVGVADDFSALYWNPAGLAQLRQREVQVAFTRSGVTMESARSGERASSDLANTRFGTLGAVYPVPVQRGSLVLAAGFNRIQGFDWVLREPGFDSQSLYTDHSYRHEGEVSLTALAAAVDVSPAVSLGATLGFLSGEDRSTNAFDWTDVDTLDLYEETRMLASETFDDDYELAFHASLGGMVRYPREEPRVRLGARVALGPTHDVSYVFRGPADTLYSEVRYDDRVVTNPDTVVRSSYEISLPIEMSAGLSVVPVKGLLLAGGVSLAEWEQTEYSGSDTEGLRAATSFEQQYRNVARYHLGAEWQIPTVAVDLRAGLYTDPLPFVGPLDPAAETDPETNPRIDIRQDRRFLTVGAGLVVDQVMHVDATWVRGHYEQGEGRLVEEWTSNRVFASVAYRF